MNFTTYMHQLAETFFSVLGKSHERMSLSETFYSKKSFSGEKILISQ